MKVNWNQIESESDSSLDSRSRSASNRLLQMVPKFSSGSHIGDLSSGTLLSGTPPFSLSPGSCTCRQAVKNGRDKNEQSRLGWVP